MDNILTIPRYNLSEEEEKKEILRQYRALLRALKPKLKPGDKELLRTAFEMAAEAHKTMRRKSGEPYILHPLAVAMICVEEIGLGVRSTICALLHDTVEDTDITLEDVERELISQAMEAAHQNATEAARLVGLGRGALRYKLARLQIGRQRRTG